MTAQGEAGISVLEKMIAERIHRRRILISVPILTMTHAGPAPTRRQELPGVTGVILTHRIFLGRAPEAMFASMVRPHRIYAMD
jgi:hypothetical protein